MLQFTGSQRVGHDFVTEQQWLGMATEHPLQRPQFDAGTRMVPG